MLLGKIHFNSGEMMVNLPDAKKTHSLLEAFYRLYQRHDDMRSLLSDATQLAIEFFQVQYCAIAWLAEDKLSLNMLASSSRNKADDFLLRVEQVIASHLQHHGHNDQTNSDFAHNGGGNRTGQDELVIPVQVNHHIVGYLYARHPNRARLGFSLTEKALLSLLSQHIGAAIETQKMREMLASRYATLTSEPDRSEALGQSALETHILAAVENPERVAKIVARSFYKELRKAGFETKQILMVATELIGSLTEALQKTKAKTDANENQS